MPDASLRRRARAGRFTPALTALGLCSIALGAARAGDLMDAYRYAAADDRRLSVAAAQVEGSEARRAESAAAGRPHAMLRLGASWHDVKDTATASRDRFTAHSHAVVLTQTLYDRAADLALIQATRGVDTAALRQQAARQDLILRLAGAYLGVLQTRARERSLEAQATALAAQRDRVQRLLAEGLSTRADAEEAQAAVDAASAEQVAARGEQAVRLEALRQLAGPDFEPDADLSSALALQLPSPADPTSWAEQARQGHLDARLAELAARQAGDEIARQQAAASPTVSLVGLHGRLALNGGLVLGQEFPAQAVRQTSIGVQLTWPIATGGAIDARVRQAQASRRSADDLAEDARRRAALGARQTYAALTTGVERQRAESRALASAEAHLRATEGAFEVGKRLGTEVLSARQRLAAAEQRLLQTRYDTLLLGLQLQAWVGALDVPALEALQRQLQGDGRAVASGTPAPRSGAAHTAAPIAGQTVD